MKLFFQFKSLLILSVLIIFTACSQKESASKQLTENDYLKATKYLGKHFYRDLTNSVKNKNWVTDEIFTYNSTDKDGKTQYYKVDAASKQKILAFDHEKMAQKLSELTGNTLKSDSLSLRSLSFNDDLSNITFSIGKDTYKCDLNTYNIESNTDETPTSNRNYSRNELLSPNGKLAAYIKDYNLWTRNIETEKKTQLTFNGKKDYGYATNNAGWVKSDGPVLAWSPNSDKIATFQQDARGVGNMYLTSTGVGHQKLESWKHPLPGDEHVFKLERIIIHLGNRPKTVRLKMDADYQRGTTTDHVAGWNGQLLDAQWKEDGSEFAFVSSSRDHKIAHLQKK